MCFFNTNLNISTVLFYAMFDVKITVTASKLKSLHALFVRRHMFSNAAIYGLFTLPDTDSDPEPGSDIHLKIGYCNDWRSGSGSESESKSMQWEEFLYSTMKPSDLESESESVSESVSKSVSGNVNKPLDQVAASVNTPLHCLIFYLIVKLVDLRHAGCASRIQLH